MCSISRRQAYPVTRIVGSDIWTEWDAVMRRRRQREKRRGAMVPSGCIGA
jgi:hypothetical protein